MIGILKRYNRQSLKHFARSLLRISLLALCRLRSRAYRPDSAPLLIIAPHQDDCTLGCGGLIYQKRLAGHPVKILYLTDGAASHLGHPSLNPKEISTLRKEEARLANQRLGVDSSALSFLDLPDGRLNSLDQGELAAAVTRLASVIKDNLPAVILLPLRHDGSSEHQAGFALVRGALTLIGHRPRVLEYPVWSLWSPRFLIPAIRHARIHRFDFFGFQSRKRHALAAYISQFEPTPPWTKSVLPEGFKPIFENGREYYFEFLT